MNIPTRGATVKLYRPVYDHYDYARVLCTTRGGDVWLSTFERIPAQRLDYDAEGDVWTERKDGASGLRAEAG